MNHREDSFILLTVPRSSAHVGCIEFIAYQQLRHRRDSADHTPRGSIEPLEAGKHVKIARLK